MIAMRLDIVNIFNIPDPFHVLGLNTCIKIKNGDQIINIQRSPILIIFAITSKSSPTVNNSNQNALNANQSVNVAPSVVISVPK